MDISELYQIYQAHPVITTDSRDCPEGSIFLALKGASDVYKRQLEDRTDSDGTTQALNELVADVTNLKVWNYQYVSLTSNVRTRCV